MRQSKNYIYIYIYIYTHTYTYVSDQIIYINRETETGREGERETETEWEGSPTDEPWGWGGGGGGSVPAGDLGIWIKLDWECQWVLCCSLQDNAGTAPLGWGLNCWKKKRRHTGFKHPSLSPYLISGTAHSHSPLPPPWSQGPDAWGPSPASRSRLCIFPGLPNPPSRTCHIFLKVLLPKTLSWEYQANSRPEKSLMQCWYSADGKGSRGAFVDY